MTVALIVPSVDHLPGFADALCRGWSPDTVRKDAAAREQLERIAQDPAGFVASLDDREARGGPITLPDGSAVPRLPGFHRWLWDGEFCGSVNFRWQPGTAALPPHVLGHIGYSVVPWKQGRGHATSGLAQLLPEARSLGLDHVMLTTDPDNLVSQRVIQANGGRLVERFRKAEGYGGGESLRWRIDL